MYLSIPFTLFANSWSGLEGSLLLNDGTATHSHTTTATTPELTRWLTLTSTWHTIKAFDLHSQEPHEVGTPVRVREMGVRGEIMRPDHQRMVQSHRDQQPRWEGGPEVCLDDPGQYVINAKLPRPSLSGRFWSFLLQVMWRLRGADSPHTGRETRQGFCRLRRLCFLYTISQG